MTDLRKAAEMALEALCSANPIGHALEDYEYHNKATEALRQALAQPEQEPKYKAQSEAVRLNTNGRMRIDPVTGDVSIGTSSKEWIGLSDVEVALFETRLSGSGLAREIEAKLRERNT